MKFSLFYFVLATTLFLTACNQKELKDSLLTADTTLQAMVISDSRSDKDKGKEECFKLIYPISVTMQDGTVLSGEEKELWQAIKTWYEANPNSDEKPSLNYPIEVFWLKGEITKSISDKDEMEIAKKYCDWNKEENKECFQLIYPITWSMSDGTDISMSDEKDWDAIKAWYEANPNSEEKPSLNYPLDIEFEDGTRQVVNDEDEMVEVKKACE